MIQGTLQRLLRAIVLTIPQSREVYEGACDGASGLLPRSESYYYMGGWHEGNARRLTDAGS